MNAKAFDFERIAQGYKRRPFLHKQIIERFQKDITFRTFSSGLDVGCGAGLSTKALKMICRHVTGVDISEEMIAVAKEVCGDTQGYDFRVGRAEELPDFDRKFDVVTAAGVVQWVDQALFLKGLKERIREHGALLVYDFGISDRMKDCDAYTRWWHDAYLREFPKPFRNESVWTETEVAQYGFLMRNQIPCELEYEFDLDSFIEFMMIQSNVNAKIEGEGRAAGNIYEWFRHSAEPLFQGEKRTLIFTGYSWYMER